MTRLFATVLLTAGLITSLASAADYYASSTHPNRSDSHPGTSPDAPWASFDKVKSAWNDMEGGDTVHLERGSQWDLSFSDDYWYMASGGSAAQGQVVMRGDDYGAGPRPILRRTSGSGSSAFLVIQKSHITIRDIELDGGHTDYGKNTLGIAIGDDNDNLSNVNILNMKIHNLGGSESEYICGIWVVSPGYTVSDCLIEGNEISDYSAHGLNHYSPGPMINITWRNNIVRNSFTGGRYPSANSALQITSGSSGCLFEHNVLEDTTTTEGCILGFGKYADDTGLNTIRFNIVTHSDEYGILFTIDHSNRKLFYDIYGNVIYDNDKSGFAIHPYNSYEPGTFFNVYNNTFVNNCTDGGDQDRGTMELDAQCANTTVDFANNLIYHNTYGDTVGLALDDGFNGAFTHRNNLYMHEAGLDRAIIRHGQTFTVANATDYENTAQNSDPQLRDPGAPPTATHTGSGATPDGYAVLASSPAVGNGVDLGTSYAQDIGRSTRGSEWTIGAYQIDPAPTPTPEPTATPTPEPTPTPLPAKPRPPSHLRIKG